VVATIIGATTIAALTSLINPVIGAALAVLLGGGGIFAGIFVEMIPKAMCPN